jgi:tRNA modification GTPase
MEQAIAALATAPAPSGISVIRVSGSGAHDILNCIFQGKENPCNTFRKLIYGKIISYPEAQTIDHALVAAMKAPHSFTGEDSFEVQCHGSLIVVQKILQALYRAGAVPAAPGEYTKRALLNGKLDLSQAEALASLISATTEAEHELAREQLEGRLSRVLELIGEPLRDALAEIEANIDFPEEDIEPGGLTHILKRVKQSIVELQSIEGSYRYGSVAKEGYRILLTGRPNAGKSSLFNVLLKKKRALVTEVSGTTRDILEEECILDGVKFILCDSAGIRETDDYVEKLGIELALERVGWADLVLLIIDTSDSSEEVTAQYNFLKDCAKKVWVINNKIDIQKPSLNFFDNKSKMLSLSSYTGEGVTTLIENLLQEVRELKHDTSESSVIIINERHKHCLSKSIEYLNRCTIHLPLEILSEELRLALQALDEIIGKTLADDILGRIFSKFCIGK